MVARVPTMLTRLVITMQVTETIDLTDCTATPVSSASLHIKLASGDGVLLNFDKDFQVRIPPSLTPFRPSVDSVDPRKGCSKMPLPGSITCACLPGLCRQDCQGIFFYIPHSLCHNRERSGWPKGLISYNSLDAPLWSSRRSVRNGRARSTHLSRSLPNLWRVQRMLLSSQSTTHHYPLSTLA